ncbi:MAG: hypothetical protein IPO17_06450 [Flavobacteriales bacterium]|nr:hypothetical protein [Flavobacteriales bacterium]
MSFFCFKDITTGYHTRIAHRPNDPAWNGGHLPLSAHWAYMSLAPDAAWGFTNLNVSGNNVNMNDGGDQLFFGQGGIWISGVLNAHNASYSGTWLFGFTSNPTWPWSAANTTQRSNLPLGMDCFSMAPTSATDFSKYTGSQVLGTQREWILRLEDPANWTTYSNCTNYDAGGTDWTTAPVLPITTRRHGERPVDRSKNHRLVPMPELGRC